jgi:quercetin dioxygenase-like cupin family protein
MSDNVILIKKGDAKSDTEMPGKVYRLKIKSDKMEAINAKLQPHTESRWFKHDGEEMHLVIEGEMEYDVGENSYKLSVGDVLWHKSNLKHRARNTSDHMVSYITVGTPPTFALSMI